MGLPLRDDADACGRKTLRGSMWEDLAHVNVY